MADAKISELPSATYTAGDQFPFVRSGVTSRGSFPWTATATGVQTTTADPITFGTNSAERMRIDSAGALLVGTTSVPNNVDNIISVNAGRFVTAAGSTGATSSDVWVTIFSLPDRNATYIVTGAIPNVADTSSYHAVAIVSTNTGGSPRSTTIQSAALLSIRVDGANVQLKQDSGVSQNMSWNCTTLAIL